MIKNKMKVNRNKSGNSLMARMLLVSCILTSFLGMSQVRPVQEGSAELKEGKVTVTLSKFPGPPGMPPTSPGQPSQNQEGSQKFVSKYVVMLTATGKSGE